VARRSKLVPMALLEVVFGRGVPVTVVVAEGVLAAGCDGLLLQHRGCCHQAASR